MPAPDHFDAMLAAAEKLHISTNGAEPIRIGDNAIYRLAGGVVARVSRPGRSAAAAKEVAVARWLERNSIPTVIALPDIEQPVFVADRAVTFWRELPPHHEGTLLQVAQALRVLHCLPQPENFVLPDLDPFVGLIGRIDAMPTISPDEREWLVGHLDHLRTRHAEEISSLRTCVVHGDAHSGNIVSTEDGTVLFLDFERAAIGPPEWDLVSSAVEYDSAGWISDSEYGSFVEGYGQDVLAWPHYDIFRDIREMRMTCYVAQLASDHKDAKGEASLRIACLQGRRGPRPWTWAPM
ncbi:aminoglycoside phosphotransferase family protein [Fodinicola feengrottensis]|uniref:phosphotransferase family protein n=1 Tax=Fodinicola feengrottensis TaxID=435914 RepID=UPI0031DA2359